MEESWRFRSIQGNICPTCLVSHFPFCSQPLPFDRNGFGGDGFHRLPKDQSFQRPFFDPSLDNPAMSRPLSHFDNRVNSMTSIAGNPNDVYGISQSWNRNQNLERDPFRQFPKPSQMANSGMVNGIHRDGFQPPPPSFDHGVNGFMRGEFVASDRNHKRMKVDEMGSGSLAQMPPLACGDYYSNPKRILSEDERRLNLIRDHGGPPSVVQLHDGMDSSFRMGSGFVRGGFTEGGNRPNIYSQESSLGERATFNESRRSDCPPRPPSNTGTKSFHDSEFGSADRMGPMLHQEPVFDPQHHFMQDNVCDEKKEFRRGEHGLCFGQQQMPSDVTGSRSDMDYTFFQNRKGSSKEAFFNSQNEQPQHSLYGQIDNPLHPSLSGHRPSNIPTGARNYVNSTQLSQDSSILLREEEYRHMNLGERSHHAPRPVHQGSHKKYHAHDFQHLQPSDFNPAKGPQYPNTANWQVSSGSSIATHENKHDLRFHGQQSNERQYFEVKPPRPENIQASVGSLPLGEQFSAPNMNNQGGYLPMSTGNSMASIMQRQMLPQAFDVHPPLPPFPPPPPPVDPPGPPTSHLPAAPSPPKTSSMYPVPASSSATVPLLHPPALEGQTFPLKHLSPDKANAIDASSLFRQPNRATRPDHFVIILRGLPGSGKSYLAKMLRDLEVDNGGDAPRIHSMDDYFMTEVEKVEESEGSKSSSSVKGKKRITKKVMEYCYEPEMEEAYRSSMLKAFKKTLDEGVFTFIIVDDRNLRVADFAQFWANAKRSGYEVYLLEATYKDPVGCAARNVHGFTADDIQKMAELWEEAPSLYLQLDVQSLFHGDDLNEGGIQEVDMDTEDVAWDEGPSGLHDGKSLKTMGSPVVDYVPDGSFKGGEGWDAGGDDLTGVKELGRSKWSDDVDEEDIERPKGAKGNSTALSGLIQAYSKRDKYVHWGDQVDKTGFSIGARKKADTLSLVIGPGAGYNLKSNPLPEEESVDGTEISWESKRHNVFQEQLRAERESFRAVFDRRRQRIGGLEMEDE